MCSAVLTARINDVVTRRWPRSLALATVYGLAMVAARPLELADGASTWYPAAGVLVAMLVIDRRVLAPVAVAVRTGVALTDRDAQSAAVELLIAVGVVSVYLAAVALDARIPSRSRVQRFALGTVVVGLLAPAAAATLSFLVLEGVDQGATHSIRSFFIGDSIGVVTVAPVFVALFSTRGGRSLHRLHRLHRLTIAAQFVGLVAIPATAAFTDVDGLFVTVLLVGLTPLLWTAVRSDTMQVAAGVLVATATAAFATRLAIDHGGYDDAALLSVQSVMLTAAIVTHVVSAARFDDDERTSEITALERHNTWMATHDPVTGLLNKAGVLLAHGASSEATTVVVVDLGLTGHDGLGGQFEDALAQEAARRVQAVADDALVGHLGGLWFAAVVRPPSGPLSFWADRLRGTWTVSGIDVTAHPVLGVARTTNDQAIDDAMFAARTARQHHVVVAEFDDDLASVAASRRARLSELHRALHVGEIVAWFQPIVGTTDRRITGVEALARWNHPRLGIVGADQFIPTAEAAGLVGAVDRAVRSAALDLAAVLLPTIGDRPFRFSVNVSASQLQPALVAELVEEVQWRGVPANRVMIEVTESVAIDDVDGARRVLDALRDAGFAVAIDDFGTGQSSMAQLRSLPVDELKIDARFVSGLPAVRDLAIIRSIRTLAHEFALDVVAEGVENEEQLAALDDCAVPHVQGFLTGAPMPADALRRLIEEAATD